MTMRRAVFVAVWCLSLVAAAQWGASAQTQPNLVLSGSDIGFKPTSERDGMIFGTIQIKVNGSWRPVVVVDGGPPKSVATPVPLQ